jgi:hypothetical protein
MGGQQTAGFSAGQNRPGQDRAIRWRRAGVGVLTSIAVVLGVAVTDAMADPPNHVIETTSGPVRGASDGVVNKFQGIRYANSTAGANRWTPPTAPARSPTIFDATTPGSACPQQVNQFSAQPPLVKIVSSSTSPHPFIRTATAGSRCGSSSPAFRPSTIATRSPCSG